MSIIAAEGALADALKIRRKGNNTKPLRAKAGRVARQAPEVMVKVSSFGKGSGHVLAHMEYISRNGKMDLENERGEILSGREQVKDLFNEWKVDMKSRPGKETRDSMHVILSMPENTPPDAVQEAVRQFAKETFGKNYKYVFALHTDEPHPHCHLTVKCLGHDGKRLQVSRGDPQVWRETFAEALRKQGIDAEATRRDVRGVVKEPERQVIRHMHAGDATHAPNRSEIKAAKIALALAQLAKRTKDANKSVPFERPWEIKVAAKQTAIMKSWADAAEALRKTGEIKHVTLADDIDKFVAATVKRGIVTNEHLLQREALPSVLKDKVAEPGKDKTKNPKPEKNKDLDR